MATKLAKPEPRQAHPSWPRHPLQSLRDEMHELIAQTFGEEDGGYWPFGRMIPSLDMSETADVIEVRMDIPGVDAKEIDVQVNNNALTISGERREQKEEKGRTFHRVERRAGTFSRTVTLPCPVKEEAIDAKYRDGVLQVTLPKSEEAKTRHIAVKT